jgi:serine/threonine protein kinase
VALPPGDYQVTAEATGFSFLERTATVETGATATLNLTLQVNFNVSTSLASNGAINIGRRGDAEWYGPRCDSRQDPERWDRYPLEASPLVKSITVRTGTDIWSLGVVLYETVTDRARSQGETPSHVVVYFVLSVRVRALARLHQQSKDMSDSSDSWLLLGASLSTGNSELL